MSNTLNEIFQDESIQHSEFYDILQKLMDAEDNLELKTRINKPTRFSALKIIADFIDEQKLPQSAKILRNFIETLFRYNISLNGKSREEICGALTNLAPKTDTNDEMKGSEVKRL